MTNNQLPHVVIVGGGFAGLAAARALRNAADSGDADRPLKPLPLSTAILSSGDRQPCAG